MQLISFDIHLRLWATTFIVEEFVGVLPKGSHPVGGLVVVLF